MGNWASAPQGASGRLCRTCLRAVTPEGEESRHSATHPFQGLAKDGSQGVLTPRQSCPLAKHAVAREGPQVEIHGACSEKLLPGRRTNGPCKGTGVGQLCSPIFSSRLGEVRTEEDAENMVELSV